MDINLSYYTDQGKRFRNEDSLAVLEGERATLAMIADGVGGVANGHVASALAIQTINRELSGQPQNERRLVDAIGKASWEINQRQRADAAMYTTIAALWISDHGAVAAHVGDTRIYQFRDGELIYQSVDHSMAQVSVILGDLNMEDLRESPERNRLVRALGMADPPKPDHCFLSIRSGDRFLLCSDGFWEAVLEEDMLRTMAETETSKQWLEEMRGIVRKKDKAGQDNHTAIAVIVTEME